MDLKPKPHLINKKTNSLIAFFVFLGTFIVYYLTLARSLSFWDCGEYITCSSIFGVPHPPGNPFYIILGRFFTILNFSHHAWIINLTSALFSALALMFTYLVSVKLVSMFLNSEQESYKAYFVGLIAAFYTAFSFTYWTNSIEAEIHAGMALFINLTMWLTFVWLEKNKDFSHQNYLLLIIYLFFLGFGLHQTTLQTAPAVLFVAVYPLIHNSIKENKSKFWQRTAIYAVGFFLIYIIFYAISKSESVNMPSLPKYMILLGIFTLIYFHLHDKVTKKVWLFALILIGLGLTPHIYLLIRSSFRPFINEGNPHNWELFRNYILRTQYGPTNMFIRRVDESGELGYNVIQKLWYQFDHHFLRYFSWQFFHAKTLSNWLQIPGNVIKLIANIIVSFLGLSGAYFQYKKNRHSFAYFFAFFFMASFAMVFVINLSDHKVRNRDYFFTTAYNFWTIWMAIGSLGLVEYFRTKSKLLSYIMLAIVIFLPILNFASQYHIHNRSKELIALDYGCNLLNGLEKNAIVFTNGDNDTFPLWYAQAVYDPYAKENVHPAKNVYPTAKTKEKLATMKERRKNELSGIRNDVTVANMSLLNTPWYIRQLRDLEGIQFTIPDKHIETCQTDQRSVLYPKRFRENKYMLVVSPNQEDTLTIKIPKNKVLYVKDLAALNIIKENFGKRPIYVATTVPDMVGIKNNLRTEGMVQRLVATKGKNLFDIDRMITNIDSVYSYRGISTENVYKDDNMKRLLRNYGSSFFYLSRHFHQKNDYQKAIEYMEKSLHFLKDDNKFKKAIAQLYIEGGYHFISNDSIDKGFEYLSKAVEHTPKDIQLPELIYQVGKNSKQNQKVIELLNKLKKHQPDNKNIDKYINEFKKAPASLKDSL